MGVIKPESEFSTYFCKIDKFFKYVHTNKNKKEEKPYSVLLKKNIA